MLKILAPVFRENKITVGIVTKQTLFDSVIKKKEKKLCLHHVNRTMYLPEIIIMELYWSFSLFCLMQTAQSAENSSGHITTPLILNGHYVSWPSRDIEQTFANNKRFIAKNIIYTRFQLCFENVFLIAPRYK